MKPNTTFKRSLGLALLAAALLAALAYVMLRSGPLAQGRTSTPAQATTHTTSTS